MRRWVFALVLLVSACSSRGIDASHVEELPTIDVASFEGLLAEETRPVVVNVWASWCIPCRSEAPLLDAAFDSFGDEVLFIGIDVEDTQGGAREFIAEFGLRFQSFFDAGRLVPSHLGGIGVPLTYFFNTAGDLVYRHNGVIDERTLAVHIDELLGPDEG